MHPLSLYPRVGSAAPRFVAQNVRLASHCIVGWVGPRAGLDKCGKSRPPVGFDPQTVQPVAIRYTDCAIPTQLHQYRPGNVKSNAKDVQIHAACKVRDSSKNS